VFTSDNEIQEQNPTGLFGSVEGIHRSKRRERVTERLKTEKWKEKLPAFIFLSLNPSV
jgi:hypothetical protein